MRMICPGYQTMDVGLPMLEPAADMALKKYRFGDPNVPRPS
jgi:hypothetical protein